MTATAVIWASALAYPGDRHLWLLVVLCAVLGACGPASMIGFDFARPAESAGAAGHRVRDHQHGGSVASMTTLFAIGALLDATGDDYHVAFSAVFVLQALGLSQIFRLRKQAARNQRERRPAAWRRYTSPRSVLQERGELSTSPRPPAVQ